MKRTKQCPKCQSLRIGHIAFQVDANQVLVRRDDDTSEEQVIRRAGDAVARSVGLRRTVTDVPQLGRAIELVGQLEAYVCTECGFHETYVREPKLVPWNDVQGFSWVNSTPPEDGPFR